MLRVRTSSLGLRRQQQVGGNDTRPRRCRPDHALWEACSPSSCTCAYPWCPQRMCGAGVVAVGGEVRTALLKFAGSRGQLDLRRRRGSTTRSQVSIHITESVGWTVRIRRYRVLVCRLLLSRCSCSRRRISPSAAKVCCGIGGAWRRRQHNTTQSRLSIHAAASFYYAVRTRRHRV